MSVSSLVDKVVKGAIATAVAATETVEEVAQRISRNAISAAMTRPKRLRETTDPLPSKKQKSSSYKFMYKSFNNSNYSEQTKKHLKNYAILRHGGPLDKAGRIVWLPLEMIQYIMSFINSKVRGRWRLAPRAQPLDLNLINLTWIANWLMSEEQRKAFGYNLVDNRQFGGSSSSYSRFQFHLDRNRNDRYPYRDQQTGEMVWPQYNINDEDQNSRRINWFDAEEPRFFSIGISPRNSNAFKTL